jgi:hypothetical protein
MTVTVFDHVRPLLLHGYSSVPVSSEDGLPHIPRWNEYRDKPMPIESQQWWYRLNPGWGIGVLGGFNGLVPIDVDTDDPEVMRALGRVLPRPVVARRGSKGLIGFYRDPSGEIARALRKNFCLPNHKPLVEVKPLGVATIPPTRHRKTGKPYRWLKCNRQVRTLFDTYVEDLGIITPDHLDALGKVLQPWCPAPPEYVPKATPATSGPVSDKRMFACAMAAVENAVARLSELQGDRNISLHNAARSLGKFVHNGIIEGGYVRDRLIHACKVNGYAAKAGIQQCYWTISSGLTRSLNDPLPVLRDRRWRAVASYQGDQPQT